MSFKKLRGFFSISNLYKVIGRVYEVITFIFRRTKISEVDAELFSAVANNRTEKVAFLLTYGANANALGSYGFRPLLTALAGKCSIEIINLLLKHGADVNAVGWLGMTPLLSAINKYRLEIVALFLRHGADVNVKRGGPLYYAVLNHYLKSNEITLSIVRVLIIAVLLDNIHAEKPDFIDRNQSISTLWDESKVILNKKLSGTLSLWDLCKEKDEHKLALLSQNEEVENVLKDLNLKDKYPYLSEEIQSQIQKGIARNNENCWKEIPKNLPEEDLKSATRVDSLFFKKSPSNDSANFSAATSFENENLSKKMKP